LRRASVKWAIPFERGSELGWFQAFAATVTLVLRTPSVLWERDVFRGRMGPSLMYALIVESAAFVWVGLAPLALSPGRLAAGIAWAAFVAVAVASCVVFFAAGATQVVLWAFGAARLPTEQTLRLRAYAATPYILGLVPFGTLVAIPWAFVLEAKVLARAHNCSAPVAWLAALAPRALDVLVIAYFVLTARR